MSGTILSSVSRSASSHAPRKASGLRFFSVFLATCVAVLVVFLSTHAPRVGSSSGDDWDDGCCVSSFELDGDQDDPGGSPNDWGDPGDLDDDTEDELERELVFLDRCGSLMPRTEAVGSMAARDSPAGRLALDDLEKPPRA